MAFTGKVHYARCSSYEHTHIIVPVLEEFTDLGERWKKENPIAKYSGQMSLLIL